MAKIPGPVPDRALEILSHTLDLLVVGTMYGHQSEPVLENRLLIGFFTIPNPAIRLSVRRLWYFWQSDFEGHFRDKWRQYHPLSKPVLKLLIELGEIVADPEKKVEEFLHSLCELGTAQYVQGDVRMTQTLFNIRQALMTELEITEPRQFNKRTPKDPLFGTVQKEIEQDFIDQGLIKQDPIVQDLIKQDRINQDRIEQYLTKQDLLNQESYNQELRNEEQINRRLIDEADKLSDDDEFSSALGE